MNGHDTSSSPHPPWTLKQLVARVSLVLSRIHVNQPNSRIRDIPNARTIRYYTSIGLFDKPASFRGRTALYEERHLLQIIAIKRLQARGLSLQEVQAHLLGITPNDLRTLADLPSGLDPPPQQDAAPSSEETGRRSTDFWSAPPALLDDDEATPYHPTTVALLQTLRLEGGVTLTLPDTTRAIDDDDLRAIENAAAPLLALLRARNLIKR